MKINIHDMIGKKYNMLTVLSIAEYKNSHYYLNCICDCGTKKVVRHDALLSGGTKSCGCSKLIKNINDIVGKKFGHLYVVKYDHKQITTSESGLQIVNHIYLAKCDCGNEILVERNNIHKGLVKSCGCIKRVKDTNDIIGNIYGNLIVDSYIGKNEDGRHIYKCKCKCGNEIVLMRHELLSGKRKSCGCLGFDANDIIGKKFGRLTVIEYVGQKTAEYKDGIKHPHYYRCRCDCGNETIVYRSDLLFGGTKSCGCYLKENRSLLATSHGMSRTRFYQIHDKMKARCYNPSSSSYDDYGGRGITVCPRWLGEDGFIHFKEDMYDEYLKKAEECGGEQYISIDRKDVNGNYEPNNCRWATSKEQNNNRTVNVYYQYNGQRLTLSQIYDNFHIDNGVSYGTFRHRVEVYGYTPYIALTIPVYKNGSREFRNITSPISFSTPGYSCPISFSNQQ